MKTEFERKLKELNFSYQCNTDGLYIMRLNNDPNRIINAQLALSEPVDEVIHGSRNNNKTQAIGLFKLRLPPEIKEKDFLILAFQNTNNHCVEFIIIPGRDLIKRLNMEHRISIDNREIDMIFWLMHDNHLYESTSIGVEGEWYYLSKGAHGRMADQTVWDYTEFFNDWDILKML
jgi:hypothetical protein